MIKAIKTYFLARLLREKLLLMAFLFIGAAIWLSGFGTRAGDFWRQQRILNARLADQEGWLHQRSEVDATAQRAIAKLDPARTLNDTALIGQVTAIASDLGLRSNVSITADARPERTSQFIVNYLRVSIQRADYTSIVKLYLELQKGSPYIGIDEFVMNTEPSNRSMVAAQFHVFSVEVVR